MRPYVKWDAQPGSPAAAREALFRAAWLAGTGPMGPTYVNLDAAMQEAPLAGPLPAVAPSRFMPAVDAAPGPAVVARVVDMLRGAARLARRV